TQRGRIEFARAGGRVNTDALDNSAGVDCSDHEVNIKILLDRLVTTGDLDRGERDRLLRDMTDDVAELVLADNRTQNAVLGIGRARAATMVAVHGRMVTDLVTRRGLDRALEVLPDPEGFAELEAAGLGLTSPELATLLAHVKLDLKPEILRTDLPDLPGFAGRLADYFPPALRNRFATAMREHPLRREIVTTVLVDEMVDGAGTSYAFRLGEELGATPDDAVRAYRVSTAVFDLPGLWAEIDALPITVPTELADEIVLESRQLVDRVSRWLLTHRPRPLAVADEITRFAPPVRRLVPRLPELLRGREAQEVGSRAGALAARGVPKTLAVRSAALQHGLGLLDVVEVAEPPDRGRARLPVEEVAALYYALSERRWSSPAASGAGQV
ncbi:NAD-glutamate dehydrogenase domain-containing protein, partial [Pseudonocardia sp. H11422]|uniref:NAD-glutamate dehydrogenase domain-containing protein n=1 Tax=Pseudonocardia sp. H11422 TaxID=2835866 RepID=UPI001BDDC642